MQKLPYLPSELIELALNDLNECMKAKNKYEINMGQWYVSDPSYEDRCQVCLAGSVIAQRLDPPDLLDLGTYAEPTIMETSSRTWKLDNDTTAKLSFLNYVRSGAVVGALDEYVRDCQHMPRKMRKHICAVVKRGRWGSIPVPSFTSDAPAFFDGMRGIVTALKMCGL